MQVIIAGKIVAYDSLGTAKRSVLMLHGWGSNRQSMSALAKALSADYHVVSVDVPGFGESERPESIWGLSEYADWITKLLEKLEIKKLYGLVGHSNGGAIAIKLASTGYPIEKLILLGASGVRGRERGRQLLYKAIAKTGKKATIILPKKLQTNVRKKWYKKIGSELYDVPGMEGSFKKVTSEDLVIEATMISVPTLLVYGSEDMATPVTYGQAYSQVIEGSQLDVVEGAGHYSFIDKPKEVTSLIVEFLAK